MYQQWAETETTVWGTAAIHTPPELFLSQSDTAGNNHCLKDVLPPSS